jgi:hypothetical protein
MTTDANVAKLRWLLTEASRTAHVTLTTGVINAICAAENKLMGDNGMVLMWQSRVDDQAAEMEGTK